MKNKPTSSRMTSCVTLTLTALLCLSVLPSAKGQSYFDPAFKGNTNSGNTGTWNTTTTNWWNGSADVAWNSGAAVFQTTNTSGLTRIVTIGGGTGVTATGLTFSTNKFWTLNSATTNDILTITNGGTIANNSTGTAAINATLAAPTGFVTTGAGIQFAGTNTGVAGTVTIEGGAATVYNSSSFGSAAIVLNTATTNGGTAFGDALDISGNGITLSNNISLANTSLAANIQNLNGTNTLAGTVTFNRGGSLIYAATNSTLTLSGGFTNNGGGFQSLLLNPNAATGGTLIFTHNGTAGGVNGVNAANPTIRSGTVIVTNGAVDPFGIAGSASTATLTVGTTGNATLQVDSVNNVVATNKAVVLGSSTNTGTLLYTGSGETSSRQIQVGNISSVAADIGGSTVQNDGTGALIFTNASFNVAATAVIATNDRVLTLQGANTNANEIRGIIKNNTVGGSGTGAVALTKAGAGNWILSGTNTYSGGTTINQGTLAISNNAAFGTGAVTFASNSTVAGLANLAVTNAYTIASAATATFDAAASTTLTNSGVLSGAGALTKVDSGTLALIASNSFSGGTTINAGTLAIGNAAGLGTGTLTVSGGTADLGANIITNTLAPLASGTIQNGSISNNGGNYSISGGTVTAILAGNNGLNASGGTLGGANTFTGTTAITSAGTLVLSTAGSLASTNINLGTSGSRGTLDLTAKSAYTLTSNQTLDGYGTLSIGSAGSGTLTENGNLAPSSVGSSGNTIAVTGNLALGSASATTLQIQGTNSFDKISVTGNIAFNGNLFLNINGGYTPVAGTTFDFFSAGSSAIGLTNVALTGSWFPGTFTETSTGIWNYATNSESWTFNEANGQLAITAVPEPATYVLFGLGALVLMVVYRRKAGQR